MDDQFLINIEDRMTAVKQAGQMTLQYFQEFRKFVRKHRFQNRKEADEISEKSLELTKDFREIREKTERLFKEFERKIVK